MKTRVFLVCIFALLFTSNSFAQETSATPPTAKEQNQEQEESAQSVEINNVKNPDWKSYKMMLKGLDAFEKHHAHAPRAEHKFILKPRKQETRLTGVSLRLATDDYSRPIVLSEDGSFSLPRDPQVEAQNAELMINRKKDLFRWWPLVQSPGLAPNQRRLGDLRLECEMFWAIHYDDLPFIARNAVRVIGGPCKTKKVTLGFPAEFMGLRSAVLVEGERRQTITIDAAKSLYFLTLFDPSFSDNAVIELVYEDNDELKKRNVNGLNVTVGF
jgi:hypothetical protein